MNAQAHYVTRWLNIIWLLWLPISKSVWTIFTHDEDKQDLEDFDSDKDVKVSSVALLGFLLRGPRGGQSWELEEPVRSSSPTVWSHECTDVNRSVIFYVIRNKI